MERVNIKLNLWKGVAVAFMIALAEALTFGFYLPAFMLRFLTICIFVFIGISVIDWIIFWRNKNG